MEEKANQRKYARQTLKKEQVKSLEEVEIANFLFLNGVKYVYEGKYPFDVNDTEHKVYRPDFYLPDYDIYIEHFGIAKDGSLPWLSEIEEQKYQDSMKWKRGIHKQNQTTLRVCPKFCVNTAKQCKIEPKCFKAGAAPAVAALSTK